MVRVSNKRKMNFSIIGIITVVVSLFILIVTLYPILNVLAISFSPHKDVVLNPFMVIPKNIDLTSYLWVLNHSWLWITYRNTIFITIAGVLLSIFLTSTFAYPLSVDGLKGRKFFSGILLFTMLFNGGLIPNFYLIQELGMYNTISALIIPGSLSAYNTILMINFFRGIPESLKEAARIDGASELYLFRKIVLPLSMPIISTLSLFYAVGRWNSFFNAVIYIRDKNKWTLQLLLREILFSSQNVLDDTYALDLPGQEMKYAVVIISIVPILCVYPFIQRYFTKGVMIGSIKG